jgi:uncharacterized membrane protein
MNDLPKRIRPYLGLLLALAAGLGLRLVNISAEPYWGDEILSLDIATFSSSFSDMLRYVATVEFHPPLYYLILRPWTAIFGTAEAATRAISVIGGLGTITAAYVGGRVLFRSVFGATVAAMLVAVLPLQVEFGQEARPYALLACMATIGMVSLWIGLRRRSIAALAVYVVSMLAAVYLHYSAFFVVFGTATWWIIELCRDAGREREASLLRWTAVHGMMFLGFFPWLEPLFYKLSLSSFTFFGRERYASPYRPVGYVGQMIDMVVYTTKAGGYLLLEHVVQSLAKVSVLAASFAAVRSLGPSPMRDRNSDAWAATYVAWMAAIPAIAFLVSPLSIAYAPIWTRHILFLSVPIALLIGFIASRIPRRAAWALLAITAVSLITPLAAILGNDAEWDHYHNIAPAGSYIAEHAKEGDLVIVGHSSVRTDLAHYLPDEIPVVSLLPIPDYGNDVFSDRHRLGVLENEGQVRGGLLNAMDTAVMIGDGLGTGVTAETVVQEKLRRLIDGSGAARVWLYSFSKNDIFVHEWFREQGWRRAFWGIEGVFALDLYSND